MTNYDAKTAKARIAKLLNGGTTATMAERIVATYAYRDERGVLVYQQVRLNPKTFRFRRPDGKGGWIWNLKEVRRILYRLREVLKADEVFVVEGEKDVNTLRKWGLTATCNPGGAGKWRKEFSEVLEGKKVGVLQDDDEPGRKHALAVAKAVAQYAAEVKLVPPFEGAKDVTEWKEHGGTKNKLLALVQSTTPFFSETSAAAGTGSAAPADASTSPTDWRAKAMAGHQLVAMIEDLFNRYLVLQDGLPFVLALWIIGTHIFDTFDIFPYLSITSPTKRCGKTRLSEIVELLCRNPLSSVNISEAALYRAIHMHHPTVIIDEAEALANRKQERSQYLIAVLQAGFRQGAVVPRCVGRGEGVEYFDVYCPKVVIAIGNLPDTLSDRSICIRMQRRRGEQAVGPFRRRRAKDEADGPLNALEDMVESKSRGCCQSL